MPISYSASSSRTDETVKMRPYDLMAILFAFPAFFLGGIGAGVPMLALLAPLGVPLWAIGVVAAGAAVGSLFLVMGFFHKLDYKQHERTGFRNTVWFHMASSPRF